MKIAEGKLKNLMLGVLWLPFYNSAIHRRFTVVWYFKLVHYEILLRYLCHNRYIFAITK